MRWLRMRYPGWAAVFWLLGCGVARAHNPLTYSADPLGGLVIADLRPDGLELRITMVKMVALAVASNDTAIDFGFVTLTVSNSTASPAPASGNGVVDDPDFDQVRSVLQQKASGLYQVSDGGTPLLPLEQDVSMTRDGDVLFHLSYPKPTASPLQFTASYLTRMPASHTDTIEIFDQAGNSLATMDLNAINTTISIPLPMPPTNTQKYVYPELAGVFLAVIMLGLWRFSRVEKGGAS